MSIHRLVKRANTANIEAFNQLMEVVRISKNVVVCMIVNNDYFINRQIYGPFPYIESRLCKVPYVTIRITNAQMKVVINNINDKHRRVKLNYSKSLLNFGDLFYRSQFGNLASKSQKAQPPYVMLYNNRHHIFIDVKALWWNEDGVVILYDVL